ncbi:hypothetical protein P175DRAFT_0520452 [Aspergillus ochraceoroseus IBT 24754]|uniref:Uncharacterized protein n=3 Tax=Aspergillus subgen. Nidulantes TaxID=2720870 RepID=A0A0F8TYH3_9EURO|nr:uncharacterized protein P175DRAFT_0520452 [Aspergillus ochraceoroseus IBT 24754]KKK12403.1 hypothetical protein ARAM_002340 [Aspergillus rambellii]KKK15023.1 hypothetical protein AOCH_004484 [Aspergillus ochraceoroseus]PTU24544.1 hypothetical protein P175DRAFT_0520452 [Aspergillus ochraceoroseus IBT 24754]
MSFKDHAPRLDFLRDSASSLNSASPSTAAYLMSVHNGIYRDEHKAFNQRQHETFCAACGAPRKAESTKTILIKNNKRKTAAQAAKGLPTNGVTIYQCLRCRRRTVRLGCKDPAQGNSAPKSMPHTAPTAPIVIPQLSTPPTVTAAPVSSSTDLAKTIKSAENASSKKRAKARKQGGLQALLAAKQSQTKASPSLDLFDFLQQ